MTVNAVTPGSLATWGAGLTSTNTAPEYGQATIPAGLAGLATEVAGGLYHSLVLKSDGTVAAWGNNTQGQVTGTITATPVTTANILTIGATTNPVTVNATAYSGVTAIAAGAYHSLALKGADGTVVAWGAGKSTGTSPNLGQSNIPAGLVATTSTGNTTVGSATLTITLANPAIVAGMTVTGPAGVLPAGTKVMSNSGTTVTLSQTALTANTAGTFSFATNVVQIAAGAYHSLALKSDGGIVGWGDNSKGQTTLPSGLAPIISSASLPPNPLGTVKQVTTTALVSGLAVGMNVTGPAGTVGPNAKVASFTTSAPFTIVFDVNNAVNNNALSTTVTLTFSPASPATAIAAGAEHSMALKSDGTVIAWGRNTEGQTTVPPSLTGVTAIAAGGNTSYALKSNGTVVAWGDNTKGQLTVPASLTNATAISAGMEFASALRSDGTVLSWGDNTYGQATPTTGLTGVKAVSAGGYHNLAIITAPLVITSQPANQTVGEGGTATFTVVAPGAISYQWQKNGVNLVNGANISGATTATLTVSNLSLNDAGVYTVIVTNPAGSVTSTGATLTLLSKPRVVIQPASTIVQLPVSGTVNASFDVKVLGGAMTYQWRKNGVAIADGPTGTGSTVSGATTDNLILTGVTLADVGSYSVFASNIVGDVASKTATLRIIPVNVVIDPAITSSLDELVLTVNSVMAPYTVTTNTPTPKYSAQGLPKGLKINSTTGVISGKPTKVGKYSVLLKAKSPRMGAATARKIMTVSLPVPPP